MAKIIPFGQTFADLRTGEQIGISRVRLATAADTVVLPNPVFDASPLGMNAAERTALTFYLGGANALNVLTISGGVAGQEIIVVSRHGGMINFGSE